MPPVIVSVVCSFGFFTLSPSGMPHRAVEAAGAIASEQIATPRGSSAAGLSGAQVIAEAERIRSTYRVPPPPGGRLDRAEQQRASEDFTWLAQAGSRYRNDLLVSDALMRTYGVMGDYYSRVYPAGAWQGYVGANHWARRRWLFDDRSAGLQRDSDRFAQSWAAIAYANGSWFWRPADLGAEGITDRPGLRETALALIEVPQIDESTLSAADRQAAREVRSQFASVSSRVHHARVAMQDLASRLAARGLSVNAADGAIALSMQGFLVDAADLIADHDFGRAKEALTRADYERNRLRGATGQ